MNQVPLLQDPFGLTGTLLEGQYRVDNVVGEGGFGVVYRGRHLSLDQPIALKVLKGLDGGDARINALVLEKFRAEARLLYTLSQSSLHIVRALDFGATTTPSGAWAPFMILEWLDGRSLAEDLNERRERGMRGRSLAESFALLEPVADGLAAAHQQSVAHRDIKPANVFLGAPRPGRPGPQVKVLDFGIAKIMKEGESAGTKGTFASFTWLYAAPEQLDPRLGKTGLATDVYAFALLLTELLTDRKPVEERDVVGIMRAATDRDRRPSPRARGANIPDAVELVCQRALAIDPRERHRSISELWEALLAARDGARRVTTMQPAAPAVAPPPVVVGPSAPVHTPPPVGSDATLGAVRDGRPSTTVPTAAPIFSPMQMSGSGGGAAPPPVRITAPPPRPMSPPPGTAPPGYGLHARSIGSSPPPGTLPPGGVVEYHAARSPEGRPGGVAPVPYHAQPRRLPFVRADRTSPVAVVTIVLFALTLLFTGSCAALYAACR